MSISVLNNLNIFFATLMCVLYVAFIFYAKKTESKFFIFFISSFINIFNYSVVLKNEYNFLSIVLLNLLFLFVIIFFYIYSDIENNILPDDFVESSDMKNLIVLSIFIFSFVSICCIFSSLYFKKSRLKNTPLLNNIVTTNNVIIKNNDIKEQKKSIEIDNTTYTIYNRNTEFIDSNKIFRNYNLIILFYMTLIMASFFINNMNDKNEG